jgi:UDP-N-acetylglucosamine--N-acetylmuramyl-(pentapeptide) pyrophosphoryl-undecaprenol N-acetylglucosamine transferase
VGAENGIEEKLVPRAGFKLQTLKIGSLNRVSLSKKWQTFLQLPLAFIKSFKILKTEKPSTVIGVGGYASGPIVLCAKILGIPCAILEQNVVPGLTNRLLGKISARIFCAFPGEYPDFKKSKIVVSGNPIRSQMKKLPSAPREPFLIFIFGGSLGALGMNTLVIEALPYLQPLYPQLRWIHQTGEKDFERVQKAHLDAGTGARVEKFIYEMASTYEAASLLICRAGASTLAEVATVGRASILVPLPTAADNHQEKNAEVFSKVGAAFLLSQNSSRGEDLARLIEKIYRERAALPNIEAKVSQFSRPDAAKSIVSVLQSMSERVSRD